MSDADFDDQLCAVFCEKNHIRHDCIEPLFQPGMSENIDFGWAYNLRMSAMFGNNRRNGESLLALKNLFGPYMRIGLRYVAASNSLVVMSEVMELFRTLLGDQNLIACRAQTIAKQAPHDLRYMHCTAVTPNPVNEFVGKACEWPVVGVAERVSALHENKSPLRLVSSIRSQLWSSVSNAPVWRRVD